MRGSLANPANEKFNVPEPTKMKEKAGNVHFLLQNSTFGVFLLQRI